MRSVVDFLVTHWFEISTLALLVSIRERSPSVAGLGAYLDAKFTQIDERLDGIEKQLPR